MSDTEQRLRDKISDLNFKWSIENDADKKRELLTEIARWNTMLDELLAAKKGGKGE